MSTSGCTYLKIKNPYPRERRIVFDDSVNEKTGERRHDYYIDGSKEKIISVTTIIHRNFPKFDSDAIIAKILRKPQWSNDPSYRYYQKSKEEIEQGWEKNRDYSAKMGSEMHLNIEKYWNNDSHDKMGDEYEKFMEFVGDHPKLIPFRTELEIFDEKHRIAGSIDMLFTDKTGKNVWIYDWKRSKEFKYDNKWQRALRPELQHLDDCNINHYSLQLNMYKYILTKYYLKKDQKIRGMYLVKIHPNTPGYEKVKIKNMKPEIKSILKQRLNELRGISESRDQSETSLELNTCLL